MMARTKPRALLRPLKRGRLARGTHLGFTLATAVKMACFPAIRVVPGIAARERAGYAMLCAL